ncbi:MAG: spore coat protein [Firmicutes bacterium]|jgi:spore coat protein CotF|nr:spore coat protein [Bacillota bacterium]
MDQNRLTDKDIATDLLSDLKDMAFGYHMAAVEAADVNVRNTFSSHHDEYMREQRELWETMNAKGWYQMHQAQQVPQQPGFQPQGRV